MEVRIYDDFVLKIQKSLESDNEVLVIEWLKGKLPVLVIYAYVVENDIVYTLTSLI